MRGYAFSVVRFMVYLCFACSIRLRFLIMEPFPVMGRPQVIDAVMKTGVRKYTLNEYLEASATSDSPVLRYPPRKRLYSKLSTRFKHGRTIVDEIMEK